MKKIFYSFIYILFIFVFIQGCSNKQVSEQIELAQKQLECGATVDSDKTIENILPKVKNKKDLAKIISLKAEISAGKGFFEEAREEIRIAVATNPNNAQIRRQSANVYLKMGDISRALSEINKANDISSDDLSISALKIYIYSKFYDNYTALYEARNILREHSECKHTIEDLNQIYLQIADILVEEKEFAKAKNIYDDILKYEPNNDKALLGIANIYYIKKNIKKAEEVVLKAIDKNVFNPQSHLLASQIYYLQNKPQKIKNELEIALSYNCTTPALAIEYGFVCLKNKDIETAEKFANIALNSAPNNADVLGFVATVSTIKDHIKQAQQYAQRALELDPNNLIANIAETEIAFKTMNFQKAEDHLKICLKQDENSVIANTYMARIRLIQNNTRDAEMFIDKALINAPHDQIILYFKSCIYAQKSDKVRAFVYLKKAVENGLKGKKNIKMDKVWQKYLNDREFQEIISKIQ